MIGLISGPSIVKNSTELVDAAIETKKGILAFKSCSSIRPNVIITSGPINIKSIAIQHPLDIIRSIIGKNKDQHTIVIDEINLFPVGLVDLCIELSFAGYTILCAGVMQDWLCAPNDTCIEMAAMADQVMKMYVNCSFCKSTFASKNIEVDDDDLSEYRPACNACYKRILDTHNVDYVGKYPRYLTSIPDLSNGIPN